MTTQIDWGDGSGDKITLTYSASEGDQTILVSSDPNTGENIRTKDITFTVTAGGTTITRTLRVRQLSNSALAIITYNGTAITDNDTAVGYKYTES